MLQLPRTTSPAASLSATLSLEVSAWPGEPHGSSGAGLDWWNDRERL